MRLIRTKYDLTLNQVSRMFETGDFRALKRFRWLPDFLAAKQYAAFAVDFAKLFNRETLSNLIADDILRLRIEHIMRNIIPVMVTGLMTGHDKFKNDFRKRYNRDFTGAPEDWELIQAEIEKLTARYKSMIPAEQVVKEKAEQAMKFEEVISYVEMILERSIDREMKLYQFQYQYQLAVKRAEEWQKMQQKAKENGRN